MRTNGRTCLLLLYCPKVLPRLVSTGANAASRLSQSSPQYNQAASYQRPRYTMVTRVLLLLGVWCMLQAVGRGQLQFEKPGEPQHTQSQECRQKYIDELHYPTHMTFCMNAHLHLKDGTPMYAHAYAT